MRLCWSRSVWDPYRRRPHASPACSHSGEYPENMSGRRRGEMVNSASPFIRHRSWQLTYCATCHAYHHLQANTSRCISITSHLHPPYLPLHHIYIADTTYKQANKWCLQTACTQHVHNMYTTCTDLPKHQQIWLHARSCIHLANWNSNQCTICSQTYTGMYMVHTQVQVHY